MQTCGEFTLSFDVVLALLLPLPTQSRSTVAPVTSRSGVLKGWTTRTNADIAIVFSTRTSTRIGMTNVLYSGVSRIFWRVTGQSPSQCVQPVSWWKNSQHSLHATGSFDRGYCSVRKEISWSQFAPKSLVLRVHLTNCTTLRLVVRLSYDGINSIVLLSKCIVLGLISTIPDVQPLHEMT